MGALKSAITLLLVVLFLASQTWASKISNGRRPKRFTDPPLCDSQCQQERRRKNSRIMAEAMLGGSSSQSQTRVSAIQPVPIPGQPSPKPHLHFPPVPGNLPPLGIFDRTATERTVDKKIKKAIHTLLPSNCEGAQRESELLQSQNGGVVGLLIPGIGFKNVFCDVRDEGGNWTVFQRRKNSNVDFFRNWTDYVNGFGDFENLWLGLEALHQMTREGDYELKITMITTSGLQLTAKYRNFRIGPGSTNYILNVSGYSGNATDSLATHNNQPFSTKDADHDALPSTNCASYYEGAWWYWTCHDSNLNGNFTRLDAAGMVWWNGPVPNYLHYLVYSEMKFRRIF